MPLDLPGTDAYYLIEQAKSVFAYGHLKIHDGNIIPFLIAGMMFLGASVQNAFYLFFVMLFSAYAALMTWFAFTIRLKWACLISLASAPLFAYYAYEFPKMSLAAVFFLLMIAFSFRGDRRGIWLSGIAASLIHPFFASLFCFTLIVLKLRPNRMASLSTTLVLAAIGLLLVRGQSGIWVFATRTNLSPYLILNCLSLLLVFTGYGIIEMCRGRRWPLYAFPALALLFLPSSRTELFDVGERVTLLLAVLCGPMLLLTQHATAVSRSKSLLSFCVIAFIVVAAQLAVVRTELPKTDYQPIATITDRLASRKLSMLIAPRAVKFFYTARTGRDAFFFEPESSWLKSETWRLTQNISRDEYSYFMPEDCQWSSGNLQSLAFKDAVLVREDCWNTFRSAIPPDDLPDLYDRVWNHEQNPSRPRAFASSFLRRLWQ